MPGLTAAQERFCQTYAKTLDYKKAYQEGYGGDEKRYSAPAVSVLKKNQLVQNRIAELTEGHEEMLKNAIREAFAITIPELMHKIYEVAQNAERDGDKLRAYELIGRHLGAFADVSPAGRTSAILHVINVPANNRAVIDLNKIESAQPFLTNNRTK